MPFHRCPHCNWREAYEDRLTKTSEWRDIATHLQSQLDKLKADIRSVMQVYYDHELAIAVDDY